MFSITDVTKSKLRGISRQLGAKLGWTGEVIEAWVIDATLQLRNP